MPDVAICDLTFKEVSTPPATTIPAPGYKGTRSCEGVRVQGLHPHALTPWISISTVDHARCCHLWFQFQRGVHTTCNYNSHPQDGRVQEGTRVGIVVAGGRNISLMVKTQMTTFGMINNILFQGACLTPSHVLAPWGRDSTFCTDRWWGTKNDFTLGLYPCALMP